MLQFAYLKFCAFCTDKFNEIIINLKPLSIFDVITFSIDIAKYANRSQITVSKQKSDCCLSLKTQIP